jgi:hypothetical protein
MQAKPLIVKPSMRPYVGSAEFLSPVEHPPPAGQKIILLTDTGTAVIGHWSAAGYRGWFPLPRIPEGMKDGVS